MLLLLQLLHPRKEDIDVLRGIRKHLLVHAQYETTKALRLARRQRPLVNQVEQAIVIPELTTSMQRKGIVLVKRSEVSATEMNDK